MDADIVRSVEMVVAYVKLSEETVWSLPVWSFFEQLEEAHRRFEIQKKNNDK